VKIGTNEGAVTFDSVRDRVVVIPFRDAEKTIHTFNPETETWEETDPFSSAFRESMQGRNAFSVLFDPKLGVHFIYIAGISQDNGIMWVYKPG